MENNKKLHANSLTIEKEINWFSELIDNRLNVFFESGENELLDPPDLLGDNSNYALFLKDNHLTGLERIILISTIALQW